MILNAEPIGAGHPLLGKIEALALEAFPPEEYLAPDRMIEMSQREQLEIWALKDGDMFVGFAVIKLYRKLAYLFFLAVEPALRSRGYGRRAVETMIAKYPYRIHTVDFEMPDESAENNAQRLRRRNFYLSCGYRETGVFLSYLGVDYEVFCMGKRFDETMFAEMMRSITIDGFEPRFFKKASRPVHGNTPTDAV